LIGSISEQHDVFVQAKATESHMILSLILSNRCKIYKCMAMKIWAYLN